MEHAFEMLGPAAVSGDMEDERGGRAYMRPVPRRPLRPLRPGLRWPRPYDGWSAWGPSTLLVDPYPVYQPFDDDGEVPATQRAAVARMPAAMQPVYVALGSVADAIRDPRSNVPGLYAIEFAVGGQARAYSGQSGNVRRRLQQHALCAQMLGLSLAGHRAFVAPLPALAAPQRRAIEQRLHTDMLARQPGVLTNQRRELEAELLGPAWR